MSGFCLCGHLMVQHGGAGCDECHCQSPEFDPLLGPCLGCGAPTEKDVCRECATLFENDGDTYEAKDSDSEATRQRIFAARRAVRYGAEVEGDAA